MVPPYRSLRLVVATRLHLGQASVAPSPEDLRTQLVNFFTFCERAQASVGVIAVDATPVLTAKLEQQKKKHGDGECPADAYASNVVFDLVQAVQEICLTITDAAPSTVTLHVLPVTPWGQFVPALNALISFAATATCRGQDDGTTENNNTAANCILFVSAETTLASKTALQSLLAHLDLETTLVVGARLPGHDYQHNVTPTTTPGSSTVVVLNGRTTPWNTLAVWNLRQLALTGFVQVSEGILTNAKTEPSQGVEEVMAISLLQHIFGPTKTMAKLVQLANAASDNDDASNGGVLLWEEKFSDPQRQAWHDAKMKSKLERAARQVALFPNEMANARVHHC